MGIITVDFETHYDKKDFSLSKMTTEEYVRDPRFQVIGVGVKVDDNETEWASGTHADIQGYLRSFDWDNSLLLCHNTLFDGAILSWIFGIKPKGYLDTLCMARALRGVEVGGSLKVLAEHYGLGVKGTEVDDANGMRLEDFSNEQLSRYGDYCINDVELTYKLFKVMSKTFPKKELKLIDLTIRMFTDPVLELDRELLEKHLEEVVGQKEALLESVGVDKSELMSNAKFASLLQEAGVKPPMKVSPTTGKETYAFAKTDEGFKALLSHDDPKVQGLANARLGNKSTLEETRTQTFIGVAERGPLPIPLKYCGAISTRWSGLDYNIQNLPSRGPNAKKIKKAILAPEGHVLIDADSAQIEARVLAWLAGQEDLLEAFANKEDVYVKMASKIYGKSEEDIDKQERFIGKGVVLGCGYGMGAEKFRDTMRVFGTSLDLEECQRIISIYRETNSYIKQFWRNAHLMLTELIGGSSIDFDTHGLLKPVLTDSGAGIQLPSGLLVNYDDLQGEETDKGIQFSYKRRRNRARLYGGKAVEQVTQGTARCIIGEQMLQVAKRYRVVMTVHDSIVVCVPEAEAAEAQEYIEGCMRWVPDWAEGLPLDCESGVARAYGNCE